MLFLSNSISLVLAWNGLIFVAMLLLLVLFTIVIYRHTNPVVSTPYRVLLTSLRSQSLALFLFVLYETILLMNVERSHAPILAVAVDNSASMTITDPEGSRSEHLTSILDSDLFQSLRENFELQYYTFANQVQPFSPRGNGHPC